MAFGQLCAPALIYIVFSITQVTIDSLKGMHNVAFVKLFISILFTILLNNLCQRGLGIVSWIIVFIPFMLMSVIVGLLLLVLGLDPKTGKLNVTKTQKQHRKNDARENSIRDYTMTRTKADYLQTMGDLGYLDFNGKGNSTTPSGFGMNDDPEFTIMWMIFAEEFTDSIDRYIKSPSINKTPQYKKYYEIFEKNKLKATKLYFMDFFSKLWYNGLNSGGNIFSKDSAVDDKIRGLNEFLNKLKTDNANNEHYENSTLGSLDELDIKCHKKDACEVMGKKGIISSGVNQEIFESVVSLRDYLFFGEGEDDTDWINILTNKVSKRMRKIQRNSPPFHADLQKEIYVNTLAMSTSEWNEMWRDEGEKAKKKLKDAILTVVNNFLDNNDNSLCTKPTYEPVGFDLLSSEPADASWDNWDPGKPIQCKSEYGGQGLGKFAKCLSRGTEWRFEGCEKNPCDLLIEKMDDVRPPTQKLLGLYKWTKTKSRPGVQVYEHAKGNYFMFSRGDSWIIASDVDSKKPNLKWKVAQGPDKNGVKKDFIIHTVENIGLGPSQKPNDLMATVEFRILCDTGGPGWPGPGGAGGAGGPDTAGASGSYPAGTNTGGSDGCPPDFWNKKEMSCKNKDGTYCGMGEVCK